MYENGRTLHEAVTAGDYFEIRFGEFRYAPPACSTPEEVVAEARKRRDVGALICDDTVFEVYVHLPKSTIGCTIVEYCGTITGAGVFKHAPADNPFETDAGEVLTRQEYEAREAWEDAAATNVSDSEYGRLVASLEGSFRG